MQGSLRGGNWLWFLSDRRSGLASRRYNSSLKRANVLWSGWRKRRWQDLGSSCPGSPVDRIWSVYLVSRWSKWECFTPEETGRVWSPAWGAPAPGPRCPRQPRGSSQCLSLREARPEVGQEHGQISAPYRTWSLHLPSPRGGTGPPLRWNGCPRSPAASGWSASGDAGGWGGIVRLDCAAFEGLQSEYLRWQADGVPVWRRKLQFPSEDLVKQLLLHIVFAGGGKFSRIRVNEMITFSPLPVLLPSKRRETAQEDVGDHSRSPDVHLQTIPTHTHTHRG